MAGYIFEFQSAPGGPAQYDPDGKIDPAVSDVSTHNREVESRELEIWQTAPDHWHGYVKHDPAVSRVWANAAPKTADRKRAILRAYPAVTITTWLGTEIAKGRITSVYQGTFGWNSTVVRLRVKGTNGRTYIGTYGYDSGDFVRLRAVKVVR